MKMLVLRVDEEISKMDNSTAILDKLLEKIDAEKLLLVEEQLKDV